MPLKFANNFTTSLSLSVSAGATSFSVANSTNAPTLAAGEYCYITIGDDTANEVRKCTQRTGSTFVCDPFQSSWQAGSAVILAINKQVIDEFSDVWTARGLIGDGNSHPLSERYASLAAAQAVYPFATALSNQIDRCVIQKVLNDAQASGQRYILMPLKTCYIDSTIWIPDVDTPNTNAAFTGGYTLIGVPTQTKLAYYGTSGFCIDCTGVNLVNTDTGTVGSRHMVKIEGLQIYSGTNFSNAAGGIRLFNSRLAEVCHNFIHSFPNGDGIVIRSQHVWGGSWYNKVHNNQIGWWHLSNPRPVWPEYGVDDKWWMNRGIVLEGNEDNYGKTHETLIEQNAIWNCKVACVDITGYDTNTNTGVGNADIMDVYGGGAGCRFIGNSFYNGFTRRARYGNVLAATSNTIRIEPTPPDVDFSTLGNPVGKYITIEYGTGRGQCARITAWNSGTYTATIAGTWDTTPDTSSDYLLGERWAIGIRADSGGGVEIGPGVYIEDCKYPVYLTGNTNSPYPQVISDFSLQVVAPFFKNSGLNYLSMDYQLNGTCAGVGSNYITLASGSSLDDTYIGFIFELTSGQGSGLSGHDSRRKCIAYDGATKRATMSKAWTVTPNTSTVYRTVPGKFPGSLTSAEVAGVMDARPGALYLPTNGIVNGMVLRNNNVQQPYESTEFPLSYQPIGDVVMWINRTGGTLQDGQVVKVDDGTTPPALAKRVITCTDTCALPRVVCSSFYGSSLSVYPNGGPVLLANRGAEVYVNIVSAVNQGDTIVASSTAGKAKADNNVTDPRKIIGYSLQYSASGQALVWIL